MDGWVRWWVGIGVRVTGDEEEIRAKMEASLKDHSRPCLLSFSCTDSEKKQNRQKQISGVCPSHCLINHLRVEIGAAEGGGHYTPLHPANLKSLKPLRLNWVREGTRGRLWDQFGVRFLGKGDGVVFKVCAKILVRLLLEHEPFFFVHFQFASVLTLNFAI